MLPEEIKFGGVAYEQDYFRYEPCSIMFSFDDYSDECKSCFLLMHQPELPKGSDSLRKY
jgi:hypothetical protein